MGGEGKQKSITKKEGGGGKLFRRSFGDGDAKERKEEG